MKALETAAGADLVIPKAACPVLALRNWYAITAPAGASRRHRQALECCREDHRNARHQDGDRQAGLETFYATSEQVDAIRKRDMLTVAKISKAANIQMQN